MIFLLSMYGAFCLFLVAVLAISEWRHRQTGHEISMLDRLLDLPAYDPKTHRS